MVRTVYCDESGFSGPNLFHDFQRYFVYAGVSMTPEAAAEAVARIKTDLGLTPEQEIKFENLENNKPGKAAIRWLLANHAAEVAVFYADKRFAAAGKFFEYTFEPILQPLKPLFYGVGFHRFVANLLFDAWRCGEKAARELIEDGQELIRNKSPEKLTRLLRLPLHLPDGDDPLTAIAAICAAYRDAIMHEIAGMDADEVATTWTNDLSDTALLTILEHWGEGGDELEVYCDDSKPLIASAARLMEIAQTEDPEIFDTTQPPPCPVKFAKPIEIVDSKGAQVGVQLADLFAGATRFSLMKPKHRSSQEWWPLVEPRLISRCVIAQPHLLNVDYPEPVVNSCILSELGQRARAGQDPLVGMPWFIHMTQQNALAIIAEEARMRAGV